MGRATRVLRMVKAVAPEAKRVRDHGRGALTAMQEVSRDIKCVRVSIAAGGQDSDG